MYPSMSLENLRRNWDGLGRVDPLWAILARPERLGRRWDGDERVFFDTGTATIQGIFAVLDRRNLRPRRITRAVDFGCGVGRLTQALAPYADRVDGVDIAPSMIALARKYNRFPDKVSYHVNDRADLELFGDDSVDLIVSSTLR